MAVILAGVSSSWYVGPFRETLEGCTLVPRVWQSVSSSGVEGTTTVVQAAAGLELELSPPLLGSSAPVLTVVLGRPTHGSLS